MSPQKARSHPHGTASRYDQGCKCVACRAAHSEYVCRRRRDREAGNPALVDAKKARDRLSHLTRMGIPLRSIAAAAGISHRTAREIAAGRTTHVRRSTLDALLGTTGKPGSGTYYVPAGPTIRLVERLQDSGMTLTQIARALGNRNHSSVPRKGNRFVFARTATAIERLAIARGVSKRNGGAASMRLDGTEFDRFMDAYGYDLDAILEAADITQDTYSQLRSGRKCSIDMAERIARAVGVPADRLFDSEEAA